MVGGAVSASGLLGSEQEWPVRAGDVAGEEVQEYIQTVKTMHVGRPARGGGCMQLRGGSHCGAEREEPAAGKHTSVKLFT